MKITIDHSFYIVLIAFVAAFFCVFGTVWPQASAKAPTSDWYEDAKGYNEAWAQHKSTGKTMLIYVYSPTCGYCHRFEEELLSAAELKTFLEPFLKVHLYPGNGSAEERLATRWRISGYPTVFLKFSTSKKLYEVSPFVRKDGKWALLSPEAFIQGIQQTGDRISQKKAS